MYLILVIFWVVFNTTEIIEIEIGHFPKTNMMLPTIYLLPTIYINLESL